MGETAAAPAEAAKKEKASLAQTMAAVLHYNSRFTYYPGLDYRLREKETRAVSRFEFYDLTHKYTNPNECIDMSVVLLAVFTMGHATRNMVLDWLKWYRRCYPDKRVPATDADEEYNCKAVGALLKKLCRCDMLQPHDYVAVTTGKHVVLVYACTLYGHIFFRNKLQIYRPYDQNVLFQTDVDVFKRLNVNSLAFIMAKHRCCTGIHLNGAYGSDKYNDLSGTVFGIAEFDFGEGGRRLYILEPVIFRVNTAIMTDEENRMKVIRRMDVLKRVVGELLVKEQEVRVIYIVENSDGLAALAELAKGNFDAPEFRRALYTSDNIVCQCGDNLEEAFLHMFMHDDGIIKIAPARKNWRL